MVVGRQNRFRTPRSHSLRSQVMSSMLSYALTKDSRETYRVWTRFHCVRELKCSSPRAKRLISMRTRMGCRWKRGGGEGAIRQLCQ